MGDELTTGALEGAVAPAGDLPLTRERAERMARVARVLVEAALQNEYVKAYCRDLTPWHGVPGMWTVQKVRENPPVRVEFEHAYVLGGLGESLAAARGKPSFGEFVGVLPVERFDPVGELNVVYVFKESSPYNRRVEQRRYMKKRLEPTGNRALVGMAMYRGKRAFLDRVARERPGALDAVRLAFGPAMTLGEFWRCARGKKWLDLPKPTERPALFEAGDEPDGVERVERPKARVRVARPKPAGRPGLFDDEPPVSG